MANAEESSKAKEAAAQAKAQAEAEAAAREVGTPDDIGGVNAEAQRIIAEAQAEAERIIAEAQAKVVTGAVKDLGDDALVVDETGAVSRKIA